MANLELVERETNLYRFKTYPRLSATAQAKILFESALAAEEKSDTKTALELYTQATKLNPNAANAWTNIGAIWFERKQRSKAEGCFRKAIEVDPNYPLPYFNLGNLFDGQIDSRGLALEYYLMALELDPRYGDAHFNIAMLCSKLGENTKAIWHFREFLKYGSEKSSMNYAAQEIQRLRAKQRKVFRVVTIPARSRVVKAKAGQG